MRTISFRKIREFWAVHPEHEASLRGWFRVAEKAEWFSFNDVRATFAHASLYKCCVVFNVGGNNLRVVTDIVYSKQKDDETVAKGCVYLLHVLTHADYDKQRWKTACE